MSTISSKITIEGQRVEIAINGAASTVQELKKAQRILAEASAHIAERIEAHECEEEGLEPKSARSFFGNWFLTKGA